LGPAIALVLLAAAAAAPTAMAATSAPSADSPIGFSQIAGCISGAKNLLVAVVVDESASLRSTDPHNLRVQGITTAVDSIQQLADSTGSASLNVEMTLSTFARTYSTLADWAPLTPRFATSLRQVAARQLPRRDTGDATDYRQALLGAQAQLDSRQQRLSDPNACKLMLWFTDGALDVDAQTAQAATELCQPGGISDSVRADGIAVIALALLEPGSGVSAQQREQLRSVAEGQGTNVTCGTVPVSSDDSTGVYLPADNPAALQRLFSGAGALIAGGTTADSVSCPGARCPNGEYTFTIDPGVQAVRAVIQATTSGSGARIRGPSGGFLRLTDSESRTIGGTSVTSLTRNQLTTVDVTFDPASKTPTRWTLSPDGPSVVDLYWFWGAHLQLTTQKVQAGGANEIHFDLVGPTGQRLDPRLYGAVHAEITVGGKPIATRIAADGSITGSLTLNPRNVPAFESIGASASVKTAPGGVRLGPVSAAEKLPVELPPAFPAVSPSELTFGSLSGIGSRTALLHVTGSQLGTTTTCLTGANVLLPGKDNASATVSARPSCLSLKANEKRDLPISMKVGSSADGIANGTVNLRLTGADGAGKVTVAIPASMHMARTIDQSTRWELVAALVLLALLFPLALVVASNFFLGRFSMASTTRIANVPVRVTSAGLHAISGLHIVRSDDLENVGFSGVRRSSRLRVDQTPVCLQAKHVFSVREPVGVATASGHVIVSSVGSCSGGTPSEAPAALGEVDACFVVLDRESLSDGEATGTLVVVLPTGVDEAGLQKRVIAMSSRPQWDQIMQTADAAGPPEEAPAVRTEPAAELSKDADASGRLHAPQPSWMDDEPIDAPVPAPVRARRSRGRGAVNGKDSAPVLTDIPGVDSDAPPLPDFLKD
jgi:hypothetical protein